MPMYPPPPSELAKQALPSSSKGRLLLTSSPTEIEERPFAASEGSPMDQPHFCIKPWMHCHVDTGGNLRPCCVASEAYGNLKEASLERIWHGPRARAFRAAHLAGERVAACNRCYEAEAVGAFSLRVDANRRFGARAKAWVRGTTRDGHTPHARPLEYDIRFSNLCNFKCRSCYHGASSRWFKDHQAVHGKANGPTALLKVFERPDALWAAFGDFVSDVESIYFAGGEPMLQAEHYALLRELRKRDRFGVKLYYNTNLSTLEFEGQSVTRLWQGFEEVTVAASLDAWGERGEVIRHGQSWARTLEIRRRLREEAPQVRFRVACTVTALNVWHLPDFHRRLVESDFAEVDDVDLNIAHYPHKLTAQVLPLAVKREAESRLIAHLGWLRRRGARTAVEGVESLLDFLWERDQSQLAGELREYCASLDALRGEDSASTFPELSSIFGGDPRMAGRSQTRPPPGGISP